MTTDSPKSSPISPAIPPAPSPARHPCPILDPMPDLAELKASNRADFDDIEATLAHLPQAALPVRHRFAPGLYIRTITIPAGTMLTSMVHKTRHPFVITRGRIRVISATEGAVEYHAPHHGLTEPGTRRLLHALEDTEWTTYHVTELTSPAAIAAEILEPSPNRHLDGAADPRLNRWRDPALP